MASSTPLGLDLQALLEQLDPSELSTFKHLLCSLTMQNELEHVPLGRLEAASARQLAELLSTHCPGHWVESATVKAFETMKRNDLMERAEEDLKEERYKSLVKRLIQEIWMNNFWPRDDGDKLYIANQSPRVLELFYDPKPSAGVAPMMVLHGLEGLGKSTMVRKLVLDWAEGRLGLRFRYVFYLSCRELSCVEPCTFGQLISRHCPELQGPILHMLTQEPSVLFVVDGFDQLGVAPGQLLGDICSDKEERKPVPILLGGLLSRKMVPGAALLVTTRPESMLDLLHLMRRPQLVEVKGLREAERWRYFSCHFSQHDDKMVRRAFKAMEGNGVLWRQSVAPVVCWVTCMTLQRHLPGGEDPEAICCTATEVLLRFVCDQLALRGAPVGIPLRALCVLAARSLWAGRSLLPAEDLARLGLRFPDLRPMLDARLLFCDGSRGCGFVHRSLQQFLAAVFYVLRPRDGDREAVGTIGGARQLFSRDARASNPALALTGHFLFGFLNESRARKLETAFGCATWLPQVRQELLGDTSQGAEPLLSTLELREALGCLRESQNGSLVRQALAPFQELTLDLQKVSDIIDAAFCLQHCTGLRSISLRVAQGIFQDGDSMEERSDSEDDSFQEDENVLPSWKDFCSVVFSFNKNLVSLDISGSFLTVLAAKMLCEKEALTHLVLEGNWYNDMLPLLCKVLRHQKCNLQYLSLASCSATASQWNEFFLTLRGNRTLTSLDLSGSYLTEAHHSALYATLKSPNCFLQRLSLEDCCLTEASCKELSSVILINKRLTHLCLAKNEFGDHGIKILCDALCFPDCQLQMLV
ncbi:NACHT, LRR and PYD domains-containing protein 2 [Ctenodactylus gundi]